MNKIKRINLENALARAPKIYSTSIKYLFQSALLPDENVIFVGKATQHTTRTERNWSSFWSEWKEKTFYTNTSSLILLTNQRWIRKWTHLSSEQGLLFSDKNKKEKFLGTLKDGYRWEEPDEIETPSNQYLKHQGRSLEEWSMSDIVFTSLKDIQPTGRLIRFTHRNDIQQKYLLIGINNVVHYSLLFEDGEKLFQLLQVATANDGKIPFDIEKEQAGINEDDDIIHRIRRLKRLFESGMISETEYQQKREEILSSL